MKDSAIPGAPGSPSNGGGTSGPSNSGAAGQRGVELAAAAAAAPLTDDQIEQLQDEAVSALRTVYDPEIPVNIYDMGLIYEISFAPSGAANVRMTLTSPNCPAAESLPVDVERKINQLAGVTSTQVDIVWDPPWTPEKMSEAARLELGMW